MDAGALDRLARALEPAPGLGRSLAIVPPGIATLNLVGERVVLVDTLVVRVNGLSVGTRRFLKIGTEARLLDRFDPRPLGRRRRVYGRGRG